MHLLSTISSLCQKPVPTRRALCLESHGLPMLGLFRVVPSSGCPCTRYPPASRSRRTSVVRLWTSVFSLFPSDLDSKGTTNIQVKFPGGWASQQFEQQSLVLSPNFPSRGTLLQISFWVWNTQVCLFIGSSLQGGSELVHL